MILGYGCAHNTVSYGYIGRNDDYEMRTVQHCVCLECGFQLDASVSVNGEITYWWDNNFTTNIPRIGIVVK